VLRSDLEAAISKLYCQILEYEARAVCQFNRNTAIQIARNVVEADSWENILDKIKASEMSCDQLKEIIDAKDQRVCTKQLDSKLDELLKDSRRQDEELLAEIKAMRVDQKELFETKEEMDYLKSLWTTTYEDTMEKNPDRVPGTCEWFLRHPKYCKSLDESASNLL
jgi:ankyrin repeat domain-containing protein 50